MPFVRPRVVAVLIGLAAASVLPQAGAQQVFRIVGPDGRVTFSDQPPMDPKAKPATVAPTTGSAGSAGASLPFELRKVASKYPVTLYTGNNCGPCGGGRAYLTGRGIPFTEKTITTAEDAQALQRLAGDNSLPLVTIGGQQLKGYSDSEWGQFLDAAGYPARSALPASWKNPAALPMVAVQRPAPAAPTVADTPAESPVAPAAAAPADNPAGIKF
ncbi:MAG: glutaredoxin family protein [Pseudomonadota bacterium]|nr:glutaredoxin family protein [Pseudomonadota bacterium]